MNESEIFTEIGKRLREVRIRAEYSIADMCRLLDTKESHYQEIEEGAQSLSPENLLTIKKVFGVEIDYLICGEESVPETIVPPQEKSFEDGIMSVDLSQVIVKGIFILSNPTDFNLSTAAIIEDEKGFHLLVAENLNELLYGEKFRDLDEARRAFIENFFNRYCLREEPQAIWSDWVTTATSDSEIYLETDSS